MLQQLPIGHQRLAVLVVLVWACGEMHARGADEDAWKFDVVHLKTGRIYNGLLVEEKPDEIKFRCVTRKPGRPTVVLATTFRRDEIDRLELLDVAEREELARRLAALDPDGKVEGKQLESLKLQPAPWGKDGKAGGLQYESKYFILTSDASEEVVRRAALRLDQIFAAYIRFLPPRLESPRRTVIVLCRSTKEYQAMAADRGIAILNSAFFNPDRNEVLSGWDLETIENAIATKRENLKKDGVAPATAKELEKTFADGLLNEGTRRLLVVLQHEAFHAYLANFVYSPDDTQVPHWLNEGLAQIFEVAMVEAGEVRVGHFDKDALQRLKERYRDHHLVPLTELLQAEGDKFAVLHASDKYAADRHYQTSLVLAHYLTYNRKLLGTKALDRYVRNLHDGMGASEAFRELIGQALPEFETEFLLYVRDLRPDGTVEKSKE